MEYTYSATPLVVVAGTPGADASGTWLARQPLAEIPMLPAGGAVVDMPVAARIRARLVELSQTGAPWDPQVARDERLHFHFANTVQVAAREPRPSVLSPKNQTSPESRPIFTCEWVRKYLYFRPVAAVVLVDAPLGEEADARLVDELTRTKARLAEYGAHLVVLLAGKDGDLVNAVPFLRRRLGLPAKTGVFGVADDFNPQEINNLVSTLYQTLLARSQEFYAQKMRELREKRKAVAPPLDLLMWDARFTLKLAYCSEFKGDNNGALKLYESAYDSLSLLFQNRAITVDSPAYTNAREVLDVVALKIFQCELPLRSAFDKFRAHLLTVARLLDANGLAQSSRAALYWRATQYARFAQICSLVRQTTAPTLGETGGMPPGIMWLDAAKLFAAEPDAAGGREDPYTVPHSELLNAQQAFLNAISDLSGLPRAKAYALASYGDWMNATDPSAALEAYKTSAKSLPQPMWPEVERTLSRKLNDGVALFRLGDASELPKDIRTSPQPFFDVTGTFERAETFIGREVRAQITLGPRFPMRLDLERLRIRHTLGQIDIEGASTYEQSRLVKGTRAFLRFDHAQPITFEFAMTALETGEVELLEIEFIAGNEFTQRLPIKPRGVWISELPVSPRTLRHLPLCEDFCKIRVDTRPAKLEIDDTTPTVAAVGELLAFRLVVTSTEPETIEPDVQVTIGDDVVLSKQLGEFAPGATAVIEGSFKAPTSMFQLSTRITYSTATDTLPVTKLHVREIDIARPFRVNFDLMPELHAQEWPAFFAPTLTLPEISRKWRLRASLLSLFGADLLLHKSRINVKCDAAELEITNEECEINQGVPHNSYARTAHAFVISRKGKPVAVASVRNLEAYAHLELFWSRQSSPEVVNVFELAPVRVNLPTQEPRVLAVVDKHGDGDDSAMTQVSYHVENATARTLNFSVSMASSTFFAFQGPKAVMLRMLPFSTRVLTYQLVPLGDGAVQNRRPLPELRVYDVNYRRTLSVLSGDNLVSLEQGSLFV